MLYLCFRPAISVSRRARRIRRAMELSCLVTSQVVGWPFMSHGRCSGTNWRPLSSPPISHPFLPPSSFFLSFSFLLLSHSLHPVSIHFLKLSLIFCLSLLKHSAQKEELLCEEEDSRDSGSLVYCGYCSNHYKKMVRLVASLLYECESVCGCICMWGLIRGHQSIRKCI